MAIAARKHGVDIARHQVRGDQGDGGGRAQEDLEACGPLLDAGVRAPGAAGVLERAANTCPVHQSLAPSVEKVIEFTWE